LGWDGFTGNHKKRNEETEDMGDVVGRAGCKNSQAKSRQVPSASAQRGCTTGRGEVHSQSLLLLVSCGHWTRCSGEVTCVCFENSRQPGTPAPPWPLVKRNPVNGITCPAPPTTPRLCAMDAKSSSMHPTVHSHHTPGSVMLHSDDFGRCSPRTLATSRTLSTPSFAVYQSSCTKHWRRIGSRIDFHSQWMARE
jgi:hypothetical protein